MRGVVAADTGLKCSRTHTNQAIAPKKSAAPSAISVAACSGRRHEDCCKSLTTDSRTAAVRSSMRAIRYKRG